MWLALTALGGNHLFRNEGNGIFSDVSLRSGRFFSQRQVARGAAFGLEAPAGATATIRESRCRIAGLRLHPSHPEGG
jgi:hypothetical protein